ncbi:hypothetical protein HYZ99_01125 [Candidatus Peregrinibacteria bacterium]|nr:hypothetical protein [Candidatus Peregrinibacteria bacterium]
MPASTPETHLPSEQSERNLVQQTIVREYEDGTHEEITDTLNGEKHRKAMTLNPDGSKRMIITSKSRNGTELTQKRGWNSQGEIVEDEDVTKYPNGTETFVFGMALRKAMLRAQQKNS